MSSSILTNASAMTALRVLEQTNNDLSKTQNRIATGLKVANAKDNASFWAVSTTMRADVNTLKAIGDNLSLADNSLGVARNGAEQITKLIDTIKTKTTQAQEGSIDKTSLQADIDAALAQIQEITRSANFNGVKLLETATDVSLLSSIGRSGTDVDASYISFRSQDLSFGAGGGLEAIDGLSVLNRGESLLASKTDGVTEFDMGGIDQTRIRIDADQFNFSTASSTDNEFRLTYTDTAGTTQSVSVEEIDGNSLAASLAGQAGVHSASWDDATGLTLNLDATAASNFVSLIDTEATNGVAVNVTASSSSVSTAQAGNELTFNYTDGDNVARTFTHTLAQDINPTADGAQALVTELMANNDFAKLFNIRYDTTDSEFKLSTANRESENTITGWGGATFKEEGDSVRFATANLNLGASAANDFLLTFVDPNGDTQTASIANVDSDNYAQAITDLTALAAVDNASWDNTNGLTIGFAEGYQFTSLGDSTVSAAALTFSDTDIAVERTQEMSFQDQPLRLGEEIAFNYSVSGTNKEVVFQVVGNDTATGTRMDDESNPNRIVLALDAREVTFAGVTGAELASEINTAVTAGNLPADFGLDTAGATFGVDVGFAVSDNKITLTTAAGGFDTLSTATTPTTDYSALLDNIETALSVATGAASQIGSAQGRIDIQKDFISALTDSLEEGIGTLVDANMNEESARLQALQVQQQLGIQALSIANQAPQALLSLFR